MPDASALVSLRDSGTLVHIGADGSVSEVGEIPGVTGGGSGGFLGLTPTEGGLLGLAASPDFTEDRLVYAYLTAAQENRVVRLTFDGTSLGEPEVVLDAIPTANIHNGGRIAFGPDGYLYVTTGDASDQGLAQEIGALNGKILRVTLDGQPAPGNPFAGSPVWTLGHRNVQGIGWDDEGRMYASEFGQNRFDELNLIEPGGNYGWPVVEGDGGGDEYVDPLLTWEPAEASPSGITVHGGAVYVAGLRGQRLWQVPVAGVGEVGEPQAYLTGEYGRLRAVEIAPDGSLWVLTNNTDSRGDPRPGDDRILPLADLLVRIHERYGRPMIVAETSGLEGGREDWLRDVVQEGLAAVNRGVDLHAICMFPAVDMPDWHTGEWLNNGICDLIAQPDGALKRVPFQPYVDELRRWQRELKRVTVLDEDPFDQPVDLEDVVEAARRLAPKSDADWH